MSKEIADRGPGELILVETLQDEVLGVLADAEPVRAVKFNFLVADVLVNSFDVFSIKRSDTSQQLVRYYSQRPNIYLF